MLITRIQGYFKSDKIFYSGHARYEMEEEELGEILDQEVREAVLTGEVIESYPNDGSVSQLFNTWSNEKREADTLGLCLFRVRTTYGCHYRL